MNRETLGVNNTFQLPVAQDGKLNPTLKNTTQRLIVLDSFFRQESSGPSISTDYTLDLSDHLTDVLSLRLWSIEVPLTYYVIDVNYGNTCFWVTNKGNTFKIFIEPGNYSNASFCVAINNAFTNPANFKIPYAEFDWPSGFTHSSPVPDIAIYNPNNGKITLHLDGWTDPASNIVNTIYQYNSDFNSETDAYYTFFDITSTKNYNESGTYPCSASGPGQLINSTLGWVMGFRLPIQPIFTDGNTPTSVLNLFGTKYFILVLDDYNQNHINNGLITITELSKTLPLPSYYNSSQPYFCIPSARSILSINTIGNLSNINGETAAALGVNPNNFLNSIQDKIDNGLGKIQQILPSAPRTLTQAQIYTVNEIIKNR
jgi:hypothetical protein